MQGQSTRPTTQDIQRNFDILNRAAKRAIVRADSGEQFPISLGRWSSDLYMQLVEECPHHRFSWMEGEVWYDGDWAQPARSLVLRTLRRIIKHFCPEAWEEGKQIINFGPHIVKVPDETWAWPVEGPVRTVTEISWNNDSLVRLEKSLRQASAAGFNAIVIKAWWKGESGNAATMESAPQRLAAEDVEASASVLLVTKRAGCSSIPEVWTLGDHARSQKFDLPHIDNEGDVAWIDKRYFTDDDGQFPCSLRALAGQIALALYKDCGGQGSGCEDWTVRERQRLRQDTTGAILARQDIDISERVMLLERAGAQL